MERPRLCYEMKMDTCTFFLVKCIRYNFLTYSDNLPKFLEMTQSGIYLSTPFTAEKSKILNRSSVIYTSLWENWSTLSLILPLPFSTILSLYTETKPKALLLGGVSMTPSKVRWCTPVSLSQQYPPSWSCPARKHTTLLWERMMARSSSKFQARQTGAVE